MMRRRETITNPRVPVVQDGSQVDEEHDRGAGIVRPERCSPVAVNVTPVFT
jgi:hypothetical protein